MNAGVLPIFLFFVPAVPLTILASSALVLLFLHRPASGVVLARSRRVLGAASRRPRVAVLLTGLSSLVLCLAIPFLRAPVPLHGDEFSYLLAAETYAQGRMTNPTHPMWRYFETLNVIQRPTYQSTYPPAQGLVLALGRITGRDPIIGVWLSLALASAATCWMLQGWVPPRWAFLGGLMAASQWCIVLAWGGTYWGGALAMLGGSLLYGALPRLLDRPRTGDAVLLAVGLAVLANTRPFEGLLISLPVAAVLLPALARGTTPLRARILHTVLPVLVVLSVIAVFMAKYDERVTGNAFRLPYQVYWSTYAGTSPFVVALPRLSDEGREEASDPEPDERASVSRPSAFRPSLDARLEENYWMWFTTAGFFQKSLLKLAQQWMFYFGPIGTIPMLGLVGAWRQRWTRFALFVCVVALLVALTTYFASAHYTAPVAGLIMLLVVQSARHLRTWRWRGRRVGRLLVRSTWVMWAASLLVVSALHETIMTRMHEELPYTQLGPRRAEIQAALEELENDHLVVVRYRPQHNWISEWVYNEADIDAAKVVWARELGVEENRELMDYFKDRRVWLLEADVQSPRLTEVSRQRPSGLLAP